MVLVIDTDWRNRSFPWWAFPSTTPKRQSTLKSICINQDFDIQGWVSRYETSPLCRPTAGWNCVRNSGNRNDPKKSSFRINKVHPPKLNSSPQKDGCWKTILSYWNLPTFQGRTVKLRKGTRNLETKMEPEPLVGSRMGVWFLIGPKYTPICKLTCSRKDLGIFHGHSYVSLPDNIRFPINQPV